MEKRQWCCMDCGWITNDNTLKSCKDCGDALILIPKRLDIALTIAVIEMQEHYRIDAVLNHREDEMELEDIGTGEIIYRIRDWEDFEHFFGRYWFNRYNYS